MKEILPQYKIVLVREKEIAYDYQIGSVHDVHTLMVDLGFADAPEEYVYMFCTDIRGKIIAMHEVCHGTLTAAPLSIRALFSRALLHNAAGIIIAHNHPTGDPNPSGDDLAVTKRIQSAGELLEIRLLDHVIIGGHDYCSMKESGYL